MIIFIFHDKKVNLARRQRWLQKNKRGMTTVRDTKLDRYKEHYLVVMKSTEPHIGHAPFLSAMCLKVSICTKSDSAEE